MQLRWLCLFVIVTLALTIVTAYGRRGRPRQRLFLKRMHRGNHDRRIVWPPTAKFLSWKSYQRNANNENRGAPWPGTTWTNLGFRNNAPTPINRDALFGPEKIFKTWRRKKLQSKARRRNKGWHWMVNATRHHSLWDGPNVCPRVTEEYNETNYQTPAINMRWCFSGIKAQYCHVTEKFRNKKMARITSYIYECCIGHTRTSGQKGCPIEYEVNDLLTTARKLNGTRFVEAFETLGLDEIISEGNFTILMPVNEAFGKEASLNGLQNIVMVGDAKSETADALKDVLAGHIIPGRHVTYLQTMHDSLVPTEHDGGFVRFNKFSFSKPMVTVNCVPILSSDRIASNGVIHVVKDLLIPAQRTLIDLISTDPRLNFYTRLLLAYDLAGSLDTPGKSTIFAPTDDAFEELHPDFQEILLGPTGDKSLNEYLVKEHIIAGVGCASGLVQNISHRFGENVILNRDENDTILVNDAKILSADIMATNGVLHIIDKKTNFTSNEALTSFIKSLIVENPSHSTNRFQGSLRVVGTNKTIIISTTKCSRNHQSAQCLPIVSHMDKKVCGGHKAITITRLFTPSSLNILEVLEADERFHTTLNLLKKTNLTDYIMNSDQPITLFAPVNEIWRRFQNIYPATTIDTYAQILKGHIFDDIYCEYHRRWYSCLPVGMDVTAPINPLPNLPYENLAMGDIGTMATNGVVHALKESLLPKTIRRRETL
ncbi:hypothetical protein CAPTEDRAFT_202446 [Capitella teleta]|uniref:FAS1 domain-containing protein n=1 Tax=Capitella teleta TaxID=283909 RepID=R7TKU5_CAPTE|nr:hypothetical protein CAPTEDRAFT_202446 [Capitella teleta]|eukprot:ELT91725.1 hypothetical protein CAPTEDRAFT_202446 [Capitella teleta]